jgi:hypothetical protein
VFPPKNLRTQAVCPQTSSGKPSARRSFSIIEWRSR